MNESITTQTDISNQISALLALRCSDLNRDNYLELIEKHGSPGKLVETPELAAHLGSLYQALCSEEQKLHALEQIHRWRTKGVEVLALGDPLYPPLLAKIYDPPLALFYRGRLNSARLQQSAIAIVGTRRADTYGCELAYHLARGCVERGAWIVSGLAYGVDTHAHRGAVSLGLTGSTAAVLGNGLPSIYPAANQRLAQQIVDGGGLLISQFEPGTPPYPSNFLDRNRIIAGLAAGVIVIQAPQRSGALATARYALEEGREVMVVPGDIRDPRYGGSNRLLKQGAALVTTLEDIVDNVSEAFAGSQASLLADPQQQGTLIRPNSPQLPSMSPSQQHIIEQLSKERSLHYEVLRYSTKENKHFDQDLLELELKELIRRVPGNHIALKTH